MNKNKGDVLLFEADNGSSEFFFAEDLKELLNSNADKMYRKMKTGKVELGKEDIFETQTETDSIPVMSKNNTETKHL